MKTSEIIRLADKYGEEVVAIRRDFHKYAEAAWREFRTTSKIAKRLGEAGIPVQLGLDVINPEYVWSYPAQEDLDWHKKRAVEQGGDEGLIQKMNGYTGAVAIIDSGKPGPTVGMRFDIDCNDVIESEDADHRPVTGGFASVNKNFTHACGHDGHAAMGIITALVLNEVKDKLTGKVKIIFQPGEEGVKGATAMVERGVVDDVDYLLATHIKRAADGDKPELTASTSGSFSTTKFDVEIKGKNAHAGGAPQNGNNAILAACAAIMMMNTFMQDSNGSTRLNIGTIQGGTGRNVVPGQCFFRMETRGATPEAEQRLYEKAVASVKAACEAYGCTYTTQKMGATLSGIADPELVADIMEAGNEVSGLGAIVPVSVGRGGTDDFWMMVRRVQQNGGKASYMNVGTDIYGNAHDGRYDFNEDILIPGAKCNIAVACYLLEKYSK